MIRNILTGVDNERLRKTSRTVEEITPHIIKLLDDMWETLDDSHGVGLAAPQIGVLRRVVVIDWEDKKYELINPEILETSGEETDDEGCLSVPDRWFKVSRPERVRARAMDRTGKVTDYDVTGRLARAFVHECDHLVGVLVTDNALEEITGR